MFVCPEVCLSVCLSRTNFKSILLFCFSRNRAIFSRQFSTIPSTKRSSIFNLGPLTHKICSPKFGKKSPKTRLVWQIDRRCLGLLGGFRGWPIRWNHAKRCGADPRCHCNDIWARRGDLNAYRLVLSVCQHDTSRTIRDIITKFPSHGRKGGQVRKWLYSGGRLPI